MNDKEQTRELVNELVADYLAAGGTITQLPDRATCGLDHHDWKRAVRGQHVVTADEVAAERKRRALIALENKDLELIQALLTGRHDKAIKFDLENACGGPRVERGVAQ